MRQLTLTAELVLNLQKFAATSKAALLFNSCTTDKQFPEEKYLKADEILKGLKAGYQRDHFEGVAHGFAVRGDMSNPTEKEAKEGSFKSVLSFVKKHL